jgi:tape measure domain-containing protein
MNAKSLELQITVAASNAIKVVSTLSDDFKKLAKSAAEFAGDSDDVKKTIDSLSASAERTAKSLKLFGANSSELKNEQANLKSGILDLVNKGLKPESEEIQSLVAQYKKLGAESDKLEAQENGLLGVFEKLKNEIGNIAVVAAAVKWDKMMIGLGSTMLEIADNFKTVREEFGTLLGDMEAGAALFDDVIKPFNDLTPFDLDTTAQATKIFLAAKVPISDLTTMLTRMGNLAQGNSQKMISYANAFSKASAKGKADMEVLNVYLDQGVPILDELAKGFNTTSEEIVKMASRGEISFKEFQLALERLTAAGGAYFGGMELASRSYSAMWEGFREALNSLASSIGSMFLPAAIKVLEWLTNLATAIDNSPLVKGVLLGALAAITTLINSYAAIALVKFIAKTWAAFAAQMGFNAALSVTNIAIAAATIAVGLLVAGFVAYAAHQQKAAQTTNSQALALKEADQAAKNYLATIKELNNEQLSENLSRMWSEDTINYLQAAVDKAESRLDELKKAGQTDSYEYKNISDSLAHNKARLEQSKAARAEAQKILTKRAQDEAAQKSDDLLQWRNEQWNKTLEGQIEEAKAELAKAKSLRTAKHSEYDETGTFKSTDGYNRTKTEIIIRDAQKRLDDLIKQRDSDMNKPEKKLPEFTTEWTKKFRTELEQIHEEEAESLKKLADNATESFGEAWKENQNAVESYAREEAALKKYYADKVADYEKKLAEEEKQRILNRHELQMKTLQDEYRFIAEQARERIDSGNFSTEDVGNFAKGTFLQGMAGTEAFAMMSGGNPITTIIDAVSKVVFGIENIQKLLNPFSTILEGLLSYSELLINDALEPIVDILLDLGETIGQILQPVVGIIATALRVLAGVIKIVTVPLNLLGNALEWLYNKVIRPVGNAIINVFNAIISALNKIPFVNIKKLKLLPLAGEAAAEAAEATKKAAAAARAKIEAMYKAQIDDINDELRYQLQSIQKQYELGLISRQQYIDQKNAYKAAADTKILEINEKMAIALEHIEENTYAALDERQQYAVASQRNDTRDETKTKSYAEKWGSVVPVLGSIAGAVVDVGVGVFNGIKTAATGFASGIKKFFGFAVGTDNIPYDMPAIVHKGEGVIPKTFNEAIKDGTYALVGRKIKESRNNNTDGQGRTSVNVTVNVEGSVIKQKDLVAEIYSGLASMIQSGEVAPLPA